VLLSRGTIKTGFRGGKEPLSSWPLNRPLPPYDIERHALERYLDLLAPLGLARPQPIEYGLRASQEHLDYWEKRLRGDGPLVIMHPVAKWESKLWPERSWSILAAALARQGARVVFSGSQEDQASNARITAQISGEFPSARLTDLSGRTSLPELMAVLSLADLVICTDTGVMHLAAALEAPVLALFGPTAPNRTGPYGQLEHVLINPVPCRPCFRRTCPNPRCLHGLSPETVLTACRERLNL
jgi:ADP-heptose:LPS heptosyltransferase